MSLTLTVNTFLLYRGCRLIKRISIRALIFGIGALCWEVYYLIVYNDITQRVALISGIAADVSVATVLIVQLVRMSKKYEMKDSPEMRGQGILMKLGLRAIQTGAFTSAYIIVAFAIFQADPLTNVSTAMTFCLGRIYSGTYTRLTVISIDLTGPCR
ncbi:hypothetical protein RQP46_009477 [Phenoliferia psychrophenolica]